MTPPTANPSQAVSPSHHGEKLSEACGAEAENDGSLSALTTATAFEEVKGEGWIFFWLFVLFFYWEDWRGRISNSCWIFLLLFGGRCCNFNELLVIFIPVLFGELISQFDTQHFSFKSWLPIDPILNPHLFFSDVSLRAFFQAGSPGNAQSYGCCIAGMPRSDSPEWFWDTSMAIGRSAGKLEDFFFLLYKFSYIPTELFRNLGTCSETKKKHTQKCILFFPDLGRKHTKKKRNSSIIHWFRRYYHWDRFFMIFLVDIFAKITTIIPTIWEFPCLWTPSFFVGFYRICCVDWWKACSFFPWWTDLWSSSDGSATCTVHGYLCCQCLESCGLW